MPKSKVLLFCCNGGLENVTFTLMGKCSQIVSIAGTEEKVRHSDLVAIFITLIYNIETHQASKDEIIALASNLLRKNFHYRLREEIRLSSILVEEYCADCEANAICYESHQHDLLRIAST